MLHVAMSRRRPVAAMSRRRLVAAGAGAAVLAWAGAPRAQTRWDLATFVADASFHAENLRWFVAEVQRATNGRLDMRLHTNGAQHVVGADQRAVQSGQVPAGEILLSAFGNEDPMFEIDGVPFVAVGYEQAERLYRIQRPFLEERFQRRGIRMLYSVPWPGQALFSRQPLNSMADYRGVRFRSANPVTSRMAVSARSPASRSLIALPRTETPAWCTVSSRPDTSGCHQGRSLPSWTRR
ncbi:hypothetical protein J4558_14045 [Leptolyngbya sp. 15MV]|nr:hypothetical protein J4558_14045 [Leptolyngbya sp. 15MV]